MAIYMTICHKTILNRWSYHPWGFLVDRMHLYVGYGMGYSIGIGEVRLLVLETSFLESSWLRSDEFRIGISIMLVSTQRGRKLYYGARSGCWVFAVIWVLPYIFVGYLRDLGGGSRTVEAGLPCQFGHWIVELWRWLPQLMFLMFKRGGLGNWKKTDR